MWNPVTLSIGGCMLPPAQYNVYSVDNNGVSYTLLSTTADTTYTDVGAVISANRRSYIVTTVTSGEVALDRLARNRLIRPSARHVHIGRS